MELPEAAPGVSPFQLLLLCGIDEWSTNWTSCLISIENLYKLEVGFPLEEIEDMAAERNRTMFYTVRV